MIGQIFSEPVTIRDATGSPLAVIPVWFCYICYFLFVVVVIYMIHNVTKTFLVNVCSRRKKVLAVLESKRQNNFTPSHVHTVDEDTNIGGQISRSSCARIQYHLQFRLQDSMKQIELETDQITYTSLKEGETGVLDFKGNLFYGFATDQQAIDHLNQQMTEASMSVWQRNNW